MAATRVVSVPHSAEIPARDSLRKSLLFLIALEKLFILLRGLNIGGTGCVF